MLFCVCFVLLYNTNVDSDFKLSQKKYSLQVTALLHWSCSQNKLFTATML